MADEVKFTDSTTDLSEGESTATLGEKAWYVVNTYSTHENKVKENRCVRLTFTELESAACLRTTRLLTLNNT